jgi:hypothetical protein
MADFTPPQDYTSAFANVPSPIASFQQGVQSGFATQQGRCSSRCSSTSSRARSRCSSAAATVAQNPTPENISQLSIAFPEMSEQFKRSYDMLQPRSSARSCSSARRSTPRCRATGPTSPRSC